MFYWLLTILSSMIVSGRLLQSSISLTSRSIYTFQPAHAIELIQSSTMPSLMHCSASCIRHPSCRTLTYEPSSRYCRLFQGSLDTGTILNGSSKVGSLSVDSRFFAGLYNASCAMCTNNRHLICGGNGRCQCPPSTFWNGSICRNALYEGASCMDDSWCRQDLNLLCTPSRKCGPPSSQTCPTNNVSLTLYTVIRNTSACAGNLCTQSLTMNLNYYTIYCMSLVVAIQKTPNLLGAPMYTHSFPSYAINTTSWNDESYYFFAIRTLPSGFILALTTNSLSIRLNVSSSRLSNNDTYQILGVNALNASHTASGTF